MACRFSSLLLLAVVTVAAPSAAAASDCTDAPAAVCAARRFVVPVVAGETEASAVYLGPGRLVTNRHVVSDRPTAVVRLPDGARRDARVVPSAYPGDLVLLAVDGLDLGAGPTAAVSIRAGMALHIVGYDRKQGLVRANPGGRLVLPAAPGKPLSRLQYDAPGSGGNSGGYLAAADGAFMGIATTGEQGLGEAIPAAEIARLTDLSGAGHEQAHARLGKAYADCLEGLRHIPARRGLLPRRLLEYVVRSCLATGNRQLVSRAGELVGRAGQLAQARELFAEALEEDPQSLDARRSLVIVLHLAGRYAEAIPHIRWLMDILPDDSEVLRLAVQAGKLAGDGAFAEAAFDRLKRRYPRLALPLREFLDAPLPPGFRAQ